MALLPRMIFSHDGRKVARSRRWHRTCIVVVALLANGENVSAKAIATATVAVALPAVPVADTGPAAPPAATTHGRRGRRRSDAHRTEPGADVAGVRRGLHALADPVRQHRGRVDRPPAPNQRLTSAGTPYATGRRRHPTRILGTVDLTSTTPCESALGTLVTKCRWWSPALPIHWRVGRNADRFGAEVVRLHVVVEAISATPPPNPRPWEWLASPVCPPIVNSNCRPLE